LIPDLRKHLQVRLDPMRQELHLFPVYRQVLKNQLVLLSLALPLVPLLLLAPDHPKLQLVLGSLSFQVFRKLQFGLERRLLHFRQFVLEIQYCLYPQ